MQPYENASLSNFAISPIWGILQSIFQFLDLVQPCCFQLFIVEVEIPNAC